MKTRGISFRGAYLAEPSYIQVKHKIGRDKIDNTQKLFLMLNPTKQNQDIILFQVGHDMMLDKDFPKVILTDDENGQEMTRYNNEIKSKWDNFHDTIFKSSQAELRKQAKKIIEKQGLKLKIKDIETPNIYSRRTVSDATVYKAVYESSSSKLISFISRHFDREMYEKSKEFYKSLNIQTIKPENLLEESSKILKSVRNYAARV